MLLDHIATILKSPTHPLGKNLNGFVDQFTYIPPPSPSSLGDVLVLIRVRCAASSTPWSLRTCDPSRRRLRRNGNPLTLRWMGRDGQH
jgi:hypothetical protein